MCFCQTCMPPTYAYIVRLLWQYEQGFGIQGHWHLDLWPGDICLPSPTPHQVWTSWVRAFSNYWLNKVLTFKVTVTLTFDLMTPKSARVIYWSWSISSSNLNFLGPCVHLRNDYHFDAVYAFWMRMCEPANP